MYFLSRLYGATDHVINIDTAETNEFVDITNAVLADFSDQLGEFAKTLMN